MMRTSKHLVSTRLLAVAGLTALAVTLVSATIVGVYRFGAARVDDRQSARDPEPRVSTSVVPTRPTVSAAPDPNPVVIDSLAVADASARGSGDRSGVRDVEDCSAPVDGESLVAVLPRSFIELATSTAWDARAVEALEQFMLLAFDADGNGVLDDFERIVAVRSLSDAAWPSSPAESDVPLHDVAVAAPVGRLGDGSLTGADLRLHHDVDETRRLDDAESPAVVGALDAEFRAEIVQRFQLDDDGHLTIDEYARFLRHYNSGSEIADLNLDGHVDEADLRIFLDIASPIETQ